MRPCKVCGSWQCQRPFGYAKPPLGLRPKYVWLQERRDEIMDAMNRYSHAGKVVPVEWIEELKAL